MKNINLMAGCVYWYKASICRDTEGDGIFIQWDIRIPVKCKIVGEKTSVCVFLNPSSGSVVKKRLSNEDLFKNPI